MDLDMDDDLRIKSNLLGSAEYNTIEGEEASERVSEEDKALMAMKEKLPKYVVDSFIAAGLDTLKVISEIDTSTDNDLLEIEEFITVECKEDTRFKPGFGINGHFKLLPGHRRRITSFINGLKQEAVKNKLKRPKQTTTNECPLVIKTKKTKVESKLESSTSSDQTTCIDPEHQATIAAKIRQQVAKWQRSQKLVKLRELKEFKHFNVNVEVKGINNLSLSVTCNICGTRCLLSYKNEHILISNSTRPVNKCVENTMKPVSSSKVKDFFLPVGTQSDLSKVSSCESPSPLPQSSPDEIEVQTDFSLSTDEPFRNIQSEQSLSCATDDEVSSNIDQVSTTETSHLQLHSDNESVCLPEESIAEPHTDWSRSARKKIALLKSGSDHDQTKITSFYDLIDNVNSILRKHPEISRIFSSSVEPTTETTAENSIQFSPLFKCIIRNAEQNLEKAPQQVRYNSLLKKFATSLLIYCGPMAYNFICCNLPRALPSLQTVQRIIAAEYSPFQEGTFRFDELLEHLKCFNASKVVSLGEDSTRVASRVQYDSETNKLVGFVLPCIDTGLPICDSFLATSFSAMEASFKEGSLAKYAFVYMIQPLTIGVPAFCLACIGTDNKFDAELVIKRWHYIHNELNQRGITLVSIGADGDTRELRAMQVSTQLLSSTQSTLSSLSSMSKESPFHLNGKNGLQ